MNSKDAYKGKYIVYKPLTQKKYPKDAFERVDYFPLAQKIWPADAAGKLLEIQVMDIEGYDEDQTMIETYIENPIPRKPKDKELIMGKIPKISYVNCVCRVKTSVGLSKWVWFGRPWQQASVEETACSIAHILSNDSENGVKLRDSLAAWIYKYESENEIDKNIFDIFGEEKILKTISELSGGLEWYRCGCSFKTVQTRKDISSFTKVENLLSKVGIYGYCSSQSACTGYALCVHWEYLNIYMLENCKVILKHNEEKQTKMNAEIGYAEKIQVCGNCAHRDSNSSTANNGDKLCQEKKRLGFPNPLVSKFGSCLGHKWR